MREEFLWTTYIHEHPLYLIEQGHPEKVVNMLADGVSKVARAMAPRPVILRLSDFKSGEYRKLKGGEKYEPHEPADLLGWRGLPVIMIQSILMPLSWNWPLSRRCGKSSD